MADDLSLAGRRSALVVVMNHFIKQLLLKVPVLSEIHERRRDLDARQAELDQRRDELDLLWMRMNTLLAGDTLVKEARLESLDERPWNHPYLTSVNIRRFRQYSDSVWRFALDYRGSRPEPFKCAFACNMAQNMYNWARLAQNSGAEAALFPSVMDGTALNSPEWEEFDGEFPDVMDGAAFLRAHPGITLKVPCHRVAFDGSELYSAYQRFIEGDREPLCRLLAQSPGLRHEVLLGYRGFYSYYRLAKTFSEYDVIYAASTPFAAYASGRPYAVFSVGGDLQCDCGRVDDLGRAMQVSFNAARFLMISNPHSLGHSRRLGLTNGVYLPYPIDDSRYCPGEGLSRREWEARFGKGVYVLIAARVDDAVKGYSGEFLKTLVTLTKRCPALRLVFLGWGSNVGDLKKTIEAAGLDKRMILLPPVGKKRLIDYYRSCDIVLDHFVYGYLGATALEAAAIGKPVIMKLRTEQYVPLYEKDTPPVMNADSPEEVGEALLRLVEHEQFRSENGVAMRDWLMRTHGAKRTVPLLLALLRVTADRVPLPPDLVNPLSDPGTEVEKEYHASCMRVRQ